MAKGLVKGFVSKPRQTPSRQGSNPDSLDVTPTADAVRKPGMRRRIFQEARSRLDEKKSTGAASNMALLKSAAESLTQSIREARLAHDVTEQILGFKGRGRQKASKKDIAQVQRLLHDLEADSNAKHIDTRTLRQVLADVKAALDTARLNNKLKEAEHILMKVHELEALIEASESEAASADLAQALDSARATSPSTTAVPKAVDERGPSPSPSVHSMRADAGRKNSYGERSPQARRTSTRSQLRNMLRTSGGWVQLPPPSSESPHEHPPDPVEDELKDPGLRRRESWLKWWPENCFSEGYALHEKEAFFERLPTDKLNAEEMELRDAIIAFLERWKGQDMASLDDIAQDPCVLQCIRKTLPQSVPLEDWVHRRQRLGRRAAPASRLAPEATQMSRWKKDLNISDPLDDLEPARCRKFQRRDSRERRPSAVFGLNFCVNDVGQICGRVAGDDESICDLPWPSTSVVPEQKSFEWIREVGAGTRRLLPSVTTRASGMVLEEVMAWRFSHRYRARRVEPVLQRMWQMYRSAKRPSTAPSCECAWCRGKLQYDISLEAHA
ncbi:unnamed protein product [Symbiodinium natans]|uniref:Uncharacterized protein n=1 Tax=Symbiodinium natans TaxID=878477 RepID=A0A812H8W9_9DINO|nr:unnamed protein product [Symbiodinium natans]